MSHISFVHCIDTEGPLYENPEATLQRVQEITGATFPGPPSLNLIDDLRAGSIDLGGMETDVQEVLSEHRIRLNSDWKAINRMLDKLSRPEFRQKYLDCEENSWTYS